MKQALKSRLLRLEQLEQEAQAKARRDELDQLPPRYGNPEMYKVLRYTARSKYKPEELIIADSFETWFVATFPYLFNPQRFEISRYKRLDQLEQWSFRLRAKADFDEWWADAHPNQLRCPDDYSTFSDLLNDLERRAIDETCFDYVPEAQRYYRLVPITIRLFNDTLATTNAIERIKAFPTAGGVISVRLPLAFPSRTIVNPPRGRF